MPGDAIAVENLHKSFGRVQALKGISFSVRRGEIFGLLGPNGAGKSTLTNILAGVLARDSGEIRLLGKEFDACLPELKERMNAVSATTSLNSPLTVRQNLRVFGRLYGVRGLEGRIDELLRLFGISHLANAKSGPLSTGEKARMLLCKGLLNSPEILLLDECTLGLDPDIAVRTRQTLLELQRQQRTTILFTSHNMEEVELLCDKIAFLDKGEILRCGSTDSIRKLVNMQSVVVEFAGRKGKLARFLERRGVRPQFPQEGVAVFEVKDIEDELARVIEPLFKVVRIRDLSIKKPKLEDVFIKLTRGELR